ncbi:MAG: polysaccharide deacetylase family protein [Terriglobales bacterium]
MTFILFGGPPASAAEKLIALTFDDGPRPYVLFGVRGAQPPVPGLLDVLDRQQVKATFFVMGWRLTPKTWGDRRYETNIGVTCLDALKEAVRRKHEIEDHTYSHVQLRMAARQKGEAWVLADVQRGAEVIRAATGVAPRYVRPPNWILPDNARRDIERHGLRVLTIANENPPGLRDVNSLDYLCAGAHPKNCPKPSLAASVVRQIEAREKKGVYTHILAFHELTSTTPAMPELIAQLKARGYRFVRLDEYMNLVGPQPSRAAK